MKKMIYIDNEVIEGYQKKIRSLQDDLEKLNLLTNKLNNDLKFLKDSGEKILVIVKSEKDDVYEYKSTEKELLSQIVLENHKIRERYDELSRRIDKMENEKQFFMLKYKEMENHYKNQIIELKNYLIFLEDRPFLSRIKNDKKQLITETIISYENNIFLETGETKTIYTENEIKQLEEEIKKISKPKGWHFKKEFVDSDGNVYHKGKLQPHLKK